jgi:hypothetical protein
MAHDIVRSFFLETVSHQLGIVPIKKIHFDYNRILAELPPEEARAAKRKFRKMWRKFVAEMNPKRSGQKYLKASLGIGAESPTRTQKNARKTIVLGKLLEKVVVPMRNAVNS